MVQSGPDRDNSAMLLPRLVHELDWHVTEVIGVTHLGSTGGTTILDLLSWWVDPARRRHRPRRRSAGVRRHRSGP